MQRDILPIVEGTTVNTKYGMVKTDHILFIAAGAFHVSKPSDLIPELQGRFPIRVELEALGPRGFRPHPHRAEERAGQAVHGAALDRRRHAPLHATARSTASPTSPTLVNERTENIGARRLHTVMEKLLDEISFDAPDLDDKDITIDEAYVDRMLADIVAQRRPVALHPVTSTRCHRSHASRLLLLLAGSSPPCGKKGPPLAPLRLAPAAVADIAARRHADEVELRFVLPTTNSVGAERIDLDRVEIYAVTIAPGAVTPPNRDCSPRPGSSARFRSGRRVSRASRSRRRRTSVRRPASA